MIRKLVLSNDTGFGKRRPRMQVKTVLKAVEKHKSFVYGEARWSKNKTARAIEFDVQARKNSKPICSGCHRKRPGYDRMAARRFEFVPLWAISVFLVYALRRVNCPQCGIVVERVPWASGKNSADEFVSIVPRHMGYRTTE